MNGTKHYNAIVDQFAVDDGCMAGHARPDRDNH